MTLPTDYAQQIDNRLKNLEMTMGRLLEIVEAHADEDSFHNLFTSQQFDQHTKDTVTLFQQNPAQFVDPFATYMPQ